MRKLQILGTVAIAGALLTGCSSASKQAAPIEPRVATVNASLTDMMMVSADRSSITAGSVTFVVKNSGVMVHELVLRQTDVSQDKLTAGTEAGKMDETGNIGETGEMDAGTSKTFTVTLSAGHYILMCNEVGHYTSGMHMAFTVN